MDDEILTRLLRRFVAATELHYAAVESMDEALANRHAFIVHRLAREIIRHGEAGRAGLLSLADGENPIVAGMVAVYSLRRHPEHCITILRRIADQGGLLGFRASIALERWASGDWELE